MTNKDVILVAPRGARWADDARTFLRASAVHLIHVSELGMVGVMMLAGHIHAVLIDHRCLTEAWRGYLAELAGLSPGTRILFLRDADHVLPAAGAVTWPDDERGAAELLGLERRP